MEDKATIQVHFHTDTPVITIVSPTRLKQTCCLLNNTHLKKTCYLRQVFPSARTKNVHKRNKFNMQYQTLIYYPPGTECLFSPVLLHLLEGLGPSVAAVCNLLYLLPFFFLLHYIRVYTPTPALPFAQVLQRKASQPHASHILNN